MTPEQIRDLEPRLRGVKERLAQLEAEAQRQAAAAAQEQEVRLVIGQVEEFAVRVRDGLVLAEWDKRRAIIRALLKRVEVFREEVRVVYRISRSPVVDSSEGGISQHCAGGVWQT
jgi:site-specific DNA recombinase